ncbi:hypothetical protein pEaSNUABM40_00327 [Erwinia phage pEa_SNUABM_40]|nr:hypothetical protein pEaSNUABM20_00323 [Erwinia phage pEa_SNUABM_20]QZE58543.1 hypothetical protein pEaSNUABM40_00327 [Erwinia phage pEa_SNUABM_40]UAW53104.1 hypothetical protein pEaSNUABM23_00322 [Erwinia phage pEa_SNUABM_23]UIW10999.1 hypothetical protein pEaSNUABM23_00322 [Erwinia phage pEa_SNUABM_31]
MSNNNLGGAAAFGSETQKHLSEQQRRASSSESGHVNKCTIVVLTSLNAHNRFSWMTADEQLKEKQIEGKVLDRLPKLIERATGPSTDTNSAYFILHPNNGVPTRIDERIKVGEGDAVIVSYTVNKAVSEMHGSLSLALFSAGETDLADLASEYGIHTISIVEESKAGPFIKALAAQVEALQTVNISSIDETDGAFEKAVIDYSVLPGNPVTVLTGAVRTFIMQTISGEVFAAIPNNGELNVKQPTTAPIVDLSEDFDEGDEIIDQNEGDNDGEATGTDLLGYKAETLTIEQMVEALEALEYDVSAMSEEGIRESFLTEQELWLSNNDQSATDDEEEEDGEEVDGDAEDEEAEEDSEEEEFDAVQFLASVLVAEELDRDGLKVLIRTQDLKVMKSDTVETLTAKLLELVEGATEEEMVETLNTFVAALQERGIDCPNMLAALSSDEEDEEEEVDGESEEEEEEDSSESADEEEDEDDIQAQIDAVTDPLDYFAFAGGMLDAEQRSAAVAAMGEDTTNMTIVQVMKAFTRIQSQTNTLDIEAEAHDEDAEDASNVDTLTELLGQYDEDTVEHVAGALGIDTAGCENVDEVIAAIADGGSEEDFAVIEALATDLGVDLSEVADGDQLDYVDAVLAVLPVYFEDSDEDDTEQEEESDEEVEDEGDNEHEQAAEGDDANDSMKFVTDVDTENSVGPMLSVDMDQTLIINYTLTDGDTYSAIESELADIEGVNYRFPFNLGKAGKAQGSMHLPAQSLLEICERVKTTRFLADPRSFDVAVWSSSLEQTLEQEIRAALYAGRIEEGMDPSEAGIVVGDFIDDEEMREAMELGHIDPSQYDELQGERLPIESLYSARTRVRPVQVDTAHVALHTTVLNIALPGFWGDQSVARMMQGAVNRVIAQAQSTEGIKVYAGFTMESAALVNNDRLFEALETLRSFDGVQSYSAADAANFDDAEDVIEVASALDTRDLPLSVLSGGLAAATFDNGGDLTILIPCSVEEEDELDEEAEDEGDDE